METLCHNSNCRAPWAAMPFCILFYHKQTCLLIYNSNHTKEKYTFIHSYILLIEFQYTNIIIFSSAFQWSQTYSIDQLIPDKFILQDKFSLNFCGWYFDQSLRKGNFSVLGSFKYIVTHRKPQYSLLIHNKANTCNRIGWYEQDHLASQILFYVMMWIRIKTLVWYSGFTRPCFPNKKQYTRYI